MWPKPRHILPPILTVRIKFACSILCGLKKLKRKSCWQVILCLLALVIIFVVALKLNETVDDTGFEFDDDFPPDDSYKLFINIKKKNVSDNMDNHVNITTNVSDNLDIYQINQTVLEFNESKRECPKESPYLKGRMVIIHPHNVPYVTQDMEKLWKEIIVENSHVKLGGWYKPTECEPKQHVAIVIPFRDRTEHLAVLLQHLHPLLKRQLAHYRIFVVEQFAHDAFNKARLMNIAFDRIKFDYNNSFDCFIFHDVDMLPENDKNIYECGQNPIHLSPSVDSLHYRLPYHELVGGVFAIRPENFEMVNGYSNFYWGWGGEDDDMYYRLQQSNLTIFRPPLNIGRYKMMRHSKRQPIMHDKIRFPLIWSAKDRFREDGLSQISTFNFSIVSIEEMHLYTLMIIDVGFVPSMLELTGLKPRKPIPLVYFRNES